MKGFNILKLGVFVALAGFWLLAAMPDARAGELTVYKSPWCGCCTGWVKHMRDNGFSVVVKEREDLSPIKSQYGVPENLQSCHTAEIDGYVFEGHVPADDVRRFLSEKPEGVTGLAVPGMPVGSPGMEQGDEKEPYPVVLFGNDGQFLYSRH